MPSPLLVARDAANRGGVIVYPTDTLWGLGAQIDREAAVRRVFQLKRRPPAEPLSVALEAVQHINRYAVATKAARRLFAALPGPLTIVLRKRATVPDVVTGGKDHVGIRVPDHPDCLALLRHTGPLTATSANLHGRPDPKSLDEVRGIFGDGVDFYLDALLPPRGAASTVVDARSDSVRILRTGAIRESRIQELLGQ